MKKRTTNYVVVVAMLLAVSLYFIGGTYARYVSSYDGAASIGVAKWAVALTATSETEGVDFETTLTPAENDNVVDGKIAPGVTAKGTVEISLAGTEVAVDVSVKSEEAALANAIKDIVGEDVTDHDITVGVEVSMPESYTVTENEDGSITIALKDGQAFTADAVATVEITVAWENDDTNSQNHTTIGEKATDAKKLSIPVTLNVQQHID